MYKVRNAQFQAPVFHLGRMFTADNQNRNPFQIGIFFHFRNDSKAVHFRHL